MLFKYINNLRIDRCCKTAIELTDDLDNIAVLLDRILNNQIRENRLEMLAEANDRLEVLVEIAKNKECLHG